MKASGEPTDDQLMLRVRSGDANAFGVLYDRLAPRLYGLALAICRDADRAADVVQETFLSIWRAQGEYRPDRGGVSPWAFGIARNRAIDNLRRARRHDRHRDTSDRPLEQYAARGDMEAAVADADSARHLRTLIAQLPDDQRDVIALAYFGQLTHAEIAEHLDLPLGTVKGRMRLALDKLSRELTSHPGLPVR